MSDIDRFTWEHPALYEVVRRLSDEIQYTRDEIIRRVGFFIMTVFGLQAVVLVLLYLTWGRS